MQKGDGTSPVRMKRTDRLYEMHAIKQKKQKNYEQIRQLQLMDGVTFQPNIHKKVALAEKKIAAMEKVEQK
jgi:hypothetical protein